MRQQIQESEERFLLCKEGKVEIARALPAFSSAAEEWLEEHREGALHDTILQLYFDVRFFLKIWELYDEHFTSLLTLSGTEISLELLCLDPSTFLDESMKLGRASILFSATLTPVDYFIQTLGGGDDSKRILLESPFPKENLCLLSADSISTKYADRHASIDAVCEMIATCAEAHRGNYFIFFPSHRYLAEVRERFQSLFPHLNVIAQQPSMEESEKEAFLSHFTAESSLQAAGRVIRTETDRGVLLLIDTRYRTSNYRKLFPSHWSEMQSIHSKEALKEALNRFWNL